MGRTQYYTAATLDGFIASTDHSLDWLFQFGTSATEDYGEFIAGVGAAVMGASTYEWLLRHLGARTYGADFVQLRYEVQKG
jgi:dihydrofolate reductase